MPPKGALWSSASRSEEFLAEKDQLILGEGSFEAGTVAASLISTEGVDFDLFLERKGWFGWREIASSTSPLASEDITADISQGTYRWRVVSAAGEGSFKLIVK